MGNTKKLLMFTATLFWSDTPAAKCRMCSPPDFKFSTWRKLWIALAECEMALGVPITPEQIAEMKEHVSEIKFMKPHGHLKPKRATTSWRIFLPLGKFVRTPNQ